MSKLRTYAPMSRVSKKVRDGAKAFAAVYRQVDRRSEGQCEWEDRTTIGAAVPLKCHFRCRKRAVDHHHTVKPRRSAGAHVSELVIHLCREHHSRCEYPFSRGRAVIDALGGGLFRCRIEYASDKWEARRYRLYAERRWTKRDKAFYRLGLAHGEQAFRRKLVHLLRFGSDK